MPRKSEGQWFRMYEGILDNPKVQKLPPDIFKGWVNLLALSKRNGGKLPAVPDIAFALRVSEVVVQKLVDAVRAASLFDATETGMIPHDWADHQYESDVSTERVKRFRDRSKKRDGTVSVTPPEAETEQNRAEQSAAQRQADSNEINRLSRILGFDERNFTAYAANIRTLVDLKAEGCDFERHILPAAEQAAKGSRAKTLSYIVPRARELRDAAKVVAAMPTAFEQADERGWHDRIRVWRTKQNWSPKWGPTPDERDCKCPPEILTAEIAA